MVVGVAQAAAGAVVALVEVAAGLVGVLEVEVVLAAAERAVAGSWWDARVSWRVL